MTTAIICTVILAALVFLLGFNVSRMRGVTAKQGGSQAPTDPASPLLIAQRAHGNAIEYVPTLLVLFLLVGPRSPAAVALPLIIGATVYHATRHRYVDDQHRGRLFNTIGEARASIAIAGRYVGTWQFHRSTRTISHNLDASLSPATQRAVVARLHHMIEFLRSEPC